MDEIPVPPPPSVYPVQPQPEPTTSVSQSPLPTRAQQSAADLVAELSASSTFICPQCHFPVKPEYYFCPNCGKNLRTPALGIGLMDQLLLYGFSIILPWIAYLAITKWQGIKYLRSPNTQAKQIGLIALGLLVVSSIVAFWLTYVWIQQFIASSVSSANSNLGGLL